MRTPVRETAANERGFMLVGVVMFMLALTILGMSLFALSSYEAQFFTASASREQSMQNAESGMELVKTLLQMEPQRLENAQLAVGQRGIKRAMAYQWRSALATDTTSVGDVNWDSTIVMVVTAASGGTERTIQARYVPTARQSPYKQLITAGRGIRYDTSNDSQIEGFELRGRVWHFVDSASDTAWTAQLEWPDGRPLITSQPVLPVADAFVDAHADLPTTTEAPLWGSGSYTMLLSNTGGTPKFFKSPTSLGEEGSEDEHNWYSFYVDKDITIRVRGTVVWVVPQGVCLGRNVTVEPEEEGVQGTLVLVAKANGRDPSHPDRGIWLQGGLTVIDDNVHVFMVSDGDIGITRVHNKWESEDADRVSVVAGGIVELGGPAPGHRQVLEYEADTMDPLADMLLGDGALPPLMSGNAMAFVIARSTWVELTPR